MLNQELKLYKLMKVYHLLKNCFTLSHCKNTLKKLLIKNQISYKNVQ